MARLAFAINGPVDIWRLRAPYTVDHDVARIMAAYVGEDVLVYRTTEVQGSYFGVARLRNVDDSDDGQLPGVVFDDIRLLTVLPSYPADVTSVTKLQLLDDSVFASILAEGAAMPVPLELMEEPAPFSYNTPDFSTFRAVVETARREARGVCALTGETAESLEIAVIWPKGSNTGLHVNNLLVLSPEACAAFEQGHFSARDDGSVLVDMHAISGTLLKRINGSGKLIFSENPNLRPGPENLAFHRRNVFGLD